MPDFTPPEDLLRAYETIAAKAKRYNRLWEYYDGEQPLVYSMERLRKVFQDFKARFSQNWCAVVVDSALDRINLKSFDIPDNAAATQLLNNLWEETEMGLEDHEAHRAALVTGESYVFVWKDADGNVEAYYNDPRQAHIFYDEDNPRKPSYAAKLWTDSKGYAHLVLYYPDRLEYYVTNRKAKDISSGKAFRPDDPPTAPNPFGQIPVFHLRRERRKVKSELANVVEQQDAANKLLADMMVAAEFGAFKQRYIISSVQIKGQLRNAPDEIWELPAGDGSGQGTQAGEFSGTDLSNFFNAIDKIVYAIGQITRTPKHYFMAQGGDPSGEALIAMEAPLNKKCQSYIENFIPTWKQAAAFILKLAGQVVAAKDIKVIFDRPESVQPLTEANIRQVNTQAGIPISTSLKWEGKTQAEIDGMLKDKQTEASIAPINPQAAGNNPMTDLRQAVSTMRANARAMMGGGPNGGTQPALAPNRF